MILSPPGRPEPCVRLFFYLRPSFLIRPIPIFYCRSEGAHRGNWGIVACP